MGELGFGFSEFRTQCLKGRSFSLSDLCCYFWLCRSPFFTCNVRSIWHTKLFFLLYTDVKEMNLPEYSLREVVLRDQGVLMPLRWVYVCVCVCKYIWIFPLSVCLRFNSGITWKCFYFIKHMREGFFAFTEQAEEEKALRWPFRERCALTGHDGD